MTISFFVPGLPKPAGSKRAFYIAKIKRAVIVDACAKTKDWQADVRGVAMQHQPPELLTGAIQLAVLFLMPRPKGHYGSGKNECVLKSSAPQHHIIKPDALKLMRAIEDALTGIIWRDDAQIVSEVIRKEYAERSKTMGAFITITTL